jgi:hypothetical protein
MGNARWTGVRLKDVLDRAGVKAEHGLQGADRSQGCRHNRCVSRFHQGCEIVKILLCLGMKSFGPSSASTAAHCATAVGFEVDCDWHHNPRECRQFSHSRNRLGETALAGAARLSK